MSKQKLPVGHVKTGTDKKGNYIIVDGKKLYERPKLEPFLAKVMEEMYEERGLLRRL